MDTLSQYESGPTKIAWFSAGWEGGRCVGNGEIKHTTTGDGHELISAFARDAWGRGLGTELAQLIVAYSFDTLALDEVHATGAPPNAVSLTLLGRLGFPHVRDIAEDDGTTAQVLTLRR